MLLPRSLQKRIFIFAILIVLDTIFFIFSIVGAFYTRKLLSKIEIFSQFNISLLNYVEFYTIFFLVFLTLYLLLRIYDYSFEKSSEEKKLLRFILLYSIAIIVFFLITRKIFYISRIFLALHFLYIFILLFFIRHTIKERILSKLSSPRIYYICKHDLLDRVITSYIKLNKYRVFRLNIPSNRDELHKFLNSLDQEKSESIFIFDFNVLNDPEFLSFFLHVWTKVDSVFVVEEIKNFSDISITSIESALYGLRVININGGLKYKLNLILKRGFDLILALVLLPIIIPIILIISILIKLESKGPVFFRHTRIGKDGKPFELIKFRTMYTDADTILKEKILKVDSYRNEWIKFRKLKSDPRITRVGKYLRKLSLDELPQIYNIIKGEMSFVGPRPVTAEELEMYYGQYSILYKSVLPGLTGIWQAFGRSNLDYEIRIKLDTYYIVNWSLFLDLYIIFRTIKTIINKEGAY